MKYSILKMISNRNTDCEKFVNCIANKKRDIPLLNQNFNFKILATAAPKCYADIIAKNQGFDICFATDFPQSSFDEKFESINAVKRDAVMEYLEGQGIDEVDVLITDHIDDLPLMQVSKRNVIVYPNKYTVNQLKQSKIPFEIFE